MKLKFHYHANNNLPLFSIFSQNPVNVTAHPILWRSMLALSSHLSKWPLSLRFHHKTLYAHLLLRTCQTSPPPDIILLVFVTCTIQIMQLHIMHITHIMHSPEVSSYWILSGTNIFLSTLFLNTLSLCSSLSMRQSFIQNLTIDKIIVLYILTFVYYWIGNWK
jgi:hypothetical protein